MATTNTAPATGFLGKYRGLAISITVLILLIVGLLLLNLFFSNQLQKSTETTNAASRQGALVQQMSKDLFFITSQYQKVLPYSDEKLVLKDTMDVFDGTLTAFAEGGVILSTEEGSDIATKQIQVAKIAGPRAKEVISEARTIWQGYLDSVYPIFDKEENNQSELLNATVYAEDNNKRLTELMDSLSDVIRGQGEKNLQYLRIAQIIGITLAVAMFLFTIFRTVRNLRENDEELELARQETTGILNTVREGLFLLDDDLVISSQYSNEMEEIFETTNIGGREFANLVQDIVSPGELDTVKEFIKLLFDPHVIEDLIGNLNPLEKIKVNLTKQDGTYMTKYLNFNFYRVMRRDKIHDVLVSVRDISDQVLLQQQLESTKEQGEQQVEMLVSFLHANPKMLKRFLVDSRESLGDINNILKEPVSSKADFKTKVDKMFIEVHRMKGEAGSMQFEAFAEKAHEFESDLAELKKVSNIEGMDFLPLAIRLDKLISYTDTLNELSSRLGNYGAEVDGGGAVAAGPSLSDMAAEWSHLPTMVEKIADETGKKVEFVMSGLVESDLNEKYRSFVNDVSIQLIRNSLVHGIEDTDDRKQKSKKETGRIDLRVSKLQDGSLELIVRDDGRGLDFSKIRKKVVDEGLATTDEVKGWSESKIVSAAFSTGFSTADETSMHAGRGVGLDVIRDGVKTMGGKLLLRHMADKFCQFEIVLPPQAA
ncbi:MAG: ATP-binding protein [Arenicella sp.]